MREDMARRSVRITILSVLLPLALIILMTATASSSGSSPSSTSADLQYMLSHLSQDELEVAACFCYEYARNPREETREQCALEMAQRYLTSKADKEIALGKMKATIQFRKDMGIDALRDAVSDPLAEDHLPLTKFLSKKTLYVSGYDNDGRSTYIFVPRLCDDHTSELKAHIWNLERAIACSKSKDKTVNAVVDFAGFSSKRHAPPFNLGIAVMTALRDHYKGVVHRIFIVNAPTAFLFLWSMFKPFAGRKTRDKIQFVNSDREKKEIIGQWYADEQAASWMLPEGKKNRGLDLEEYLQTPFHIAFDE